MADTPFTLLVVDDNDLNREVAARRLARQGYHVLTRDSGLAALAALGQERIDLVVLDVMMPGMSGLEVLERIRQQPEWSGLPVIMATARTESEDVVTALDLGASDYVSKPVDFEVLFARIRVHLRGRTPRPAPATTYPRMAHPSVSTAPTVDGEAPVAAATASTVPGVPPASDSTDSRESSVPAGTLPADLIIDGRYRIEELLGYGGFGCVYRAQHLTLQSPVAIKVLHRKLMRSPVMLQRFQLEGVSACRVRHPNAVTILDAGQSDGCPYLVMELLSGSALSSYLSNTPVLPLARVAAIAIPICQVLEEAHRAGIIHRDIKPANILLSETPRGEVVKVVDFGIARFVEAMPSGSPRLTRTETIIGTPQYMAPERLMGSDDHRSDIFSVGVLLYECLTGTLPVGPVDKSVLLMAARQVAMKPVPVRERRPDVPAEVNDVVMAALALDPEKRPPLSEVLSVLERAGQAAV
jgi:CheY-like chemotaxis protein